MNKSIIAAAVGIATLGMAATAQASIEEGQLTVWIGGDKAHAALAEIGKTFEADTGVPVKVEFPDDVTGKFTQAAATGAGPDVIIWAHDRFGGWVESGLLQPVSPSKDFREKFYDVGWQATNYGGTQYGYPITTEAVGLIYNKDLVANPPKTWDEVFALDKELQKQGKHAILWDYNNTYFSWGLIGAHGGYVFGEKDGSLNPQDVGVNNKGAVAGVQVLRDLIENGHMPAGADYPQAHSQFANGEVAMTINGPWTWSDYEKAGINFDVTYLPGADSSKPGTPFVGVLSAGVNAASPNADLVQEFMENYLLTFDGLKTMNDDKDLGAVAHKEFQQVLGKNPLIAQTSANANVGVLMPNISAVDKMWAAVGPALENVTSGRQSPQDAMDTAAARMLK